MDCQFGNHYFKQKQSGSSGHVHFQGTRKISCKVHVVVRTITVFSGYQLSTDEACLGSRKMKKKKELQQLHQSLANNEQDRLYARGTLRIARAMHAQRYRRLKDQRHNYCAIAAPTIP